MHKPPGEHQVGASLQTHMASCLAGGLFAPPKQLAAHLSNVTAALGGSGRGAAAAAAADSMPTLGVSSVAEGAAAEAAGGSAAADPSGSQLGLSGSVPSSPPALKPSGQAPPAADAAPVADAKRRLRFADDSAALGSPSGGGGHGSFGGGLGGVGGSGSVGGSSITTVAAAAALGGPSGTARSDPAQKPPLQPPRRLEESNAPDSACDEAALAPATAVVHAVVSAPIAAQHACVSRACLGCVSTTCEPVQTMKNRKGSTRLSLRCLLFGPFRESVTSQALCSWSAECFSLKVSICAAASCSRRCGWASP